ncbi:MAG: tetratricopeptide repeat protein [Candidatus Pseudobacter hemicellulosilyticus]|uniref:Tetratricopeptide repeat protein n=1 Tax=Candidatus Pseudobacter hemicellulosilyticus TaxID=3121375 RepID=A0AAJ5WPZ9_9BACT|nr:MAG: tetratricopeptide repeat protein [Pseudobacter sp.]
MAEVKHTEQTTTHKTVETVRRPTAEQFWSKNSKLITGALVAIILIIGGFIAYNNFVKGPEEEKAGNAMWGAQNLYKIDSFNLALNGNGATQGFLKIISKYGGTESGNLAKFYAGSCYLQLGDFNNAVKYLKDFSTGSQVLQVRTNGLLGDAYAELGKKPEAVDYYKKAGTIFKEDNINSPEYLFRAALLYQDLGKNKEAIAMLQQLKKEYPLSPRGFEADKYLAKLGETK